MRTLLTFTCAAHPIPQHHGNQRGAVGPRRASIRMETETAAEPASQTPLRPTVSVRNPHSRMVGPNIVPKPPTRRPTLASSNLQSIDQRELQPTDQRIRQTHDGQACCEEDLEVGGMGKVHVQHRCRARQERRPDLF